MNHVRTIETLSFERHLQSAPLLKFHQTIQLRARCQTTSHTDKLFGQIDSRNRAAVFRRKVARRPANPAPYIEQPQSRTQFHVPSQLLRSLDPSNMKFVDRRQIRSGKLFGVLPLPRHRRKNRFRQPPPPIMPSNRRLSAHSPHLPTHDVPCSSQNAPTL